ncbi:MAG: hypothetical protein DRH24_19145, partial [Deltaproteobacteria bacterium]
MNSGMAVECKLPWMRLIHQRYEVPPKIDVLAEVDRGWMRLKDDLDLKKGASVAVGVGSRGISDLAIVVRAVVAKLKEAGYRPFIIPAMGSHGGATAAGQVDVLRSRGITEESVGASIVATMDVIPMGEVVTAFPCLLTAMPRRPTASCPSTGLNPIPTSLALPR